MPGGLTRVAGRPARPHRQQPERGVEQGHVGARPASPSASPASGSSPSDTIEAIEPETSMSPRAAENLFWLSRYAERAEDLVRQLRVASDRLTEFAPGTNPAGNACVDVLLAALTHTTGTYPGFVGDGRRRERLAEPGPEFRALLVDADRAGSVAHSVRRHAQRRRPGARPALERHVARRRPPRARPRRARPQPARRRRHRRARPGDGGDARPRRACRPSRWCATTAGSSWRPGRRLERGLQLCALLQATITTRRDAATDSLVIESVLTVGREHHHLPPPLPVARPGRDDARPAGARRRQPPVARLPGGAAGRRGRGHAAARGRVAPGASTALRRRAGHPWSPSPTPTSWPAADDVGTADRRRRRSALARRRSSPTSRRCSPASATPSTSPTSPTSCPQRVVAVAPAPGSFAPAAAGATGMTYRVVHRTAVPLRVRGVGQLRRGPPPPPRDAEPADATCRRSPSTRSPSTTASGATSSATGSPTSPCSSRTGSSPSPPPRWSTSATGGPSSRSSATCAWEQARDLLHRDTARRDARRPPVRRWSRRRSPASVGGDRVRRAARSPPAGRWSRRSTELCTRLHTEFEFAPGATTVSTPVDEVLARRAGRVPGLRPPHHRGPAGPRASRRAT